MRVHALLHGQPVAAETSPWGLPFDVLLALGAPVSLFWWGWWISPILFFIFGAIAMATMRRLESPTGAWFLAACLPLQQSIINYFFPARADHHSFIHLLLFAIVFALACRRFVAAGVLIAVMFWASLEGIFMVALAPLGLAIAAILSSETERPTGLRNLRQLLWAIALGATLAVAIQVPAGLSPAWRWDGVSLRYVASLWVAVIGVSLVAPSSSQRKLIAMGAAIAAAAAVAFFATAPLDDELGGEPNRRMLAYLTTVTSDAIPIHRSDRPLPMAVLAGLSPAILLFPFAARSLSRAKLVPLAAITSIYVALIFQSQRWLAPAATFVLLSIAWWIGRALDHRFGDRAPVHALLLGLVLALATRAALSASATTPAYARLQPVEPLLETIFAGDRPSKVLTYVALGPVVEYRVGAGVLGTPYYRDGADMETSFRWFLAVPPDTAIREARERGFCGALIVTTTEVAELRHARRLDPSLPPIEQSLAHALATDRWAGLGVQLRFEAPVPNASYRVRLFELCE
jgi:hypothetical protein